MFAQYVVNGEILNIQCLLFVQVPVDIAPSFRVLDKLSC